jgi:predicted nucleic acid-binding protein
MKKVFFDTWGWVAIAHKEDDRHKDALSFYKAYLLKKGIPVTTDYVLAETVTLLRAKTHGVDVFIDAILSAAKEEKILIERIGEARWEKAWALSKKYQDKPDVSFVDRKAIVTASSTSCFDGQVAFMTRRFSLYRPALNQTYRFSLRSLRPLRLNTFLGY